MNEAKEHQNVTLHFFLCTHESKRRHSVKYTISLCYGPVRVLCMYYILIDFLSTSTISISELVFHLIFNLARGTCLHILFLAYTHRAHL